MDKLAEIYNNPRFGLLGPDKLYEKVKQYGITQKQIKEFLTNRAENQIYKPPTKPNEYFPIYCNVGDCFQADIVFFPTYKNANKGYEMILNLIRINNRFVYAMPLKNKDGQTVAAALNTLFKQTKIKNGISLLTDDGNEFNNVQVNKIYKSFNVTHNIADPKDKNKLGIVERFNGTIRRLITKWITINNNIHWVDVLDDLIYNYNNTKHRTLGKAPADMTKKDENDLKIKQILKTARIIGQYNFNIGDNVRVVLKKKTFAKDKPTYSKAVYTIQNKEGLTYTLLNTNGQQLKEKYKGYEMMKINVNKLMDIPEQTNRIEATKQTKIKRLNKKEFKGPEVDKVDETGVTFKQRLQPTHTKRESKKPQRYR